MDFWAVVAAVADMRVAPWGSLRKERAMDKVIRVWLTICSCGG